MCLLKLIYHFQLISEYRALADYKTETEGDLSFVEGDVLLVYWANENGWWFGAAGSAQGWFPGSYVEVRYMYIKH